jgi:ATP-dependent RNA helicase DDX21
VYADFELYGSSLGLAACAVYGGAPYGPQENKLRRGVDIVIGTPGRIKVISCYFSCSDLSDVTFLY